MGYNRLLFLRCSFGVLLTSFFLLMSGCTRSGGRITAFDTDDHSHYRYLYAIHCNGIVDRLDLIKREKVGSFQLAERSGNPPTVAALSFPSPLARPGICLAQPVGTEDTRDPSTDGVSIVTSAQEYPDSDGSAPFNLLTFSLPDWTLVHTRDLGRFDLRHEGEPRLVRAADGYLILQPFSINPDNGLFSQSSK